jgi:hypothetical protein
MSNNSAVPFSISKIEKEEGSRLKRYRLSMEFDLEIEELTEEVARRGLEKFSNRDELLRDYTWDEHYERQKRILHALLNRSDMLNRYVLWALVNEFELDAKAYLEDFLSEHGYLGNKSDQDEAIISTVVDELSQEDQETLKKSIDDGVFWESHAEFIDCFHLKLRSAAVNEIEANGEISTEPL